MSLLFEACTDGCVRGVLGGLHDDPEQLSSQVAAVSLQEDSAIVLLLGAGELSLFIKQREDMKDLSSQCLGSILKDPVQFSWSACFATRDNPSSDEPSDTIVVAGSSQLTLS